MTRQRQRCQQVQAAHHGQRPTGPTLEWGVGAENDREDALGPWVQGPDSPMSGQTNTQKTGSKPCPAVTGATWGNGGRRGAGGRPEELGPLSGVTRRCYHRPGRGHCRICENANTHGSHTWEEGAGMEDTRTTSQRSRDKEEGLAGPVPAVTTGHPTLAAPGRGQGSSGDPVHSAYHLCSQRVR